MTGPVRISPLKMTFLIARIGILVLCLLYSLQGLRGGQYSSTVLREDLEQKFRIHAASEAELNNRVQDLEDLHLDRRLALLETAQIRADEERKEQRETMRMFWVPVGVILFETVLRLFGTLWSAIGGAARKRDESDKIVARVIERLREEEN